jgi:16S rRNA (uracil1498-N3)-methyltransferase
MDWLIEKAVELGVSAIQPLQAARSVVRLSGERATKRQAHWQALIEAACEQCGRNRLPALAPVANGVMAGQRAGHCCKAAALATRIGIAARTGASRARGMARRRRDVADRARGRLVAGRRRSRAPAGFIGVSLGPRILRTETAGLTCLATLNAILGGF